VKGRESVCGPVTGSCENNNETLGSIKAEYLLSS
jgi:hypothetical protein